ncbi:copper resistance D family protein [Halobacillus hunanensis]|uniref:copper resistance D family protein n=1 Tax=Halobacillus hunanensis TaxID=578214 RepID=UPI001FE60698|nr:CopD family protein [Halobacillus hunanensis]
MFFLTVISQGLLYSCFALLMAYYISSLVSSDRKPNLSVPKAIRLMAAVGIALFSFMPILQLVLYLIQDYGLGQALQSVLLTFEVGKSWVYTFVVSIILSLFILFINDKKHKGYSLVGIGLVLLLIFGLGWSSHASSIDPIKGFVIHTLHFTAVSVWVGLVLVAGWFSQNTANWIRFLKWFHVTAICCFIVTLLSGLLLMQFAMDWQDYADTWMVSYGQSILLKHLLIIPLIGYAFINGILMKKKLKKSPGFDPRPWTKVEFIIILLIFTATSALSQQSPPSNLASIISLEGLSPLFTLFYEGPINTNLSVELVFGANSVLLSILAVLFFVLNIVSFMKKMPPLFSFLMVSFFMIAGYLALLLSVRVV